MLSVLSLHAFAFAFVKDVISDGVRLWPLGIDINSSVKLLFLTTAWYMSRVAGIKHGGFPLSEAVRLSLETAGLAEGSVEGPGDAVAQEAASHLAAYLVTDFGAAAAAWKSRHKYQLRGSARVLHCWLARTSDPALADLRK